MPKQRGPVRTAGAVRRPRVTPTHRVGTDEGISLVEVVMATVLLGILSSIVLAVVLQTQSAAVGNRARVAAANLAAREIDLVRQEFAASDDGPTDLADAGVVTNPHPLDGGTAGDPLVVDGVPYTVVRSAGWNVTGDGVSACDGGSLVQYPTLGVTVTVTWPNMGLIEPVVSHAALAPDKGDGVTGESSFVAVSVVDSAGQPNPGRSVRVASGGDVRSGLTDATGCAVIEVAPAESGTDYTVTLTDSGHVDIGGSANPSKTTGVVARGSLNNSVTFAYDRAGTVLLKVYDPSGDPLVDGDVSGGQATLVASEYSGASGETVHSLTGVTTPVGNLWPGVYGGYFGTVAPPGGYPSVEVEPGATVELQIPYAAGELRLTQLPAGTNAVVAVPQGATGGCAAPGAKQVSASPPSADVQLLPGTWDFYVRGTTFSCSPGPTGVGVGTGVNGELPWSTTTRLRVHGAVPAGTLWAVDPGLAGTLSTCPSGAAAAHAVNVDGARSGHVPIVAGDWFLYVTNGAAGGSCRGVLPQFNPRTVLYAQDNDVTWEEVRVRATVRNVEYIDRSFDWSRFRYVETYPTVLISSSSSLTCTGSTTTPAIGNGTVSLGKPGSTSQSLETTLAPGTWYVYGWDDAGFWSGNRCRPAGTFVVGPTSGPLSLDYTITGSRPVVGP